MAGEEHGPYDCVTARYARLAKHEIKSGHTHRFNVVILENAIIREIFPYGPRTANPPTPAEVIGLEDS